MLAQRLTFRTKPKNSSERIAKTLRFAFKSVSVFRWSSSHLEASPMNQDTFSSMILCNNKISFVYNFSMLEFVQDHGVIFHFVYNPERTDSDTSQSNQVIFERFADVWIVKQFLNNFNYSFLHVIVLDLL